MAQHLVQEQFTFGSLDHDHIEFDVAYLHPQPEINYWAVVGGFVSDQNTPNTYVAAVQLVCPDFAEVECWRLEKLAINQTIVLGLGEPLWERLASSVIDPNPTISEFPFDSSRANSL